MSLYRLKGFANKIWYDQQMPNGAATPARQHEGPETAFNDHKDPEESAWVNCMYSDPNFSLFSHQNGQTSSAAESQSQLQDAEVNAGIRYYGLTEMLEKPRQDDVNNPLKTLLRDLIDGSKQRACVPRGPRNGELGTAAGWPYPGTGLHARNASAAISAQSGAAQYNFEDLPELTPLQLKSPFAGG